MLIYRIVLKDGREYRLACDLTTEAVVKQEGKELKELYVCKGEVDEREIWDKVFPRAQTYGY